ncbi:hypothetical protein FIA58_017740 [Flavobacterium jejuense]|uniref:Outer membrane protein beta-barrel domain-containing protein n=1 Tax=Flavobacterium jejuense TaxID=1544455 RepID=A0ABX0J0Q6_9FLAO|nr:hypothetical protein [Flavobacterium jejuense]NHN27525.1 hypothetical protein [Flavobacterium jejuense]
MIKRYLFIIIISTGFTVFGQESQQDSIRPLLYSRQFTSEKQISIRVGGGIQKKLFTEIGLALHKCTYGDTGFFSNDFYTALEWFPNRESNLYALKMGCEANANLINVALEVKYQTDFQEKDVVIIPKIGLGLFGDVNMFYGYSISTNNEPFSDIIGKHQVSIVFNFNNHFLRYK